MDLNSNDIKLYTKDETNFDHNKRVISEAVSCYVTESIDGIFYLDLEHPLNDTKQLSGDLLRENIIKSPISQTDARGDQLFTIRKRSTNTKNNRVSIYAQAKARRDFDKNMVLGLEVPAGTTRKSACQMLLTKCVLPHNYYIGNLDTNPNTSINMGLDENTGAVINYLDISATSTLKGFLSDSENSIFKAYGGEIIYNNFEINMVDERGTDHNIFIESGKNLEELQQDIDDTDTENFATAVLPCSSDGVYLPDSEIIYSPNAATLGEFLKRVVYDDVTLVDNTPEAFNVVYAQLRERVQKDFNNGLDKIKETNTIKYVQVMNTEEYKPYKKLFTEKCEIGNNVTVRYYMKNDPTKYIDAVGRVVKIKYNVLKGRIEEIEIGDRKKKSVLDTITSAVTNVSNVNQKTNVNKAKIKKVKKEVIDYTDSKANEITVNFQAADGAIRGDVSTLDGRESSHYEQLKDSIRLCVLKDDFGSYITMNVSSIVQAIVDATGSHELILDTNGATVKNGGLIIEDADGNKIMGFVPSSGTCVVKDLDMMNGSAIEKGSAFYNTLANMEEVYLMKLKVGNLIGSSSDIYISDFGGTLEEYIDNRIANH